MSDKKIKLRPLKQHVFVNAFARIHMGFLDLSGQPERHFGSLGLGLNNPDTLIELAIGDNVFKQHLEKQYVLNSKLALLEYAGVDECVSIRVHREIPRHFGLGSGTQMALAIGEGINQLFGLKLTLDEIANITGRGKRSGIGVGTFSSGGFVVDGGRSHATEVPPIIAQHPFPKAWRVLLVFDHQHVGVHGEEEQKAFASLESADLHTTYKVCHQVLMHAMPALKEQDLNTFGKAISLLQAYTGDYFAPIQGSRFASQCVAQVLDDLTEHGVLCVGQSSWGPTGFAVFESEMLAQRHITRLKSAFKNPALSWCLCEPNHTGAHVSFKTNS